MVRYCFANDSAHAESLRAALALAGIDANVRHAQASLLGSAVPIEVWGPAVKYEDALAVLARVDARETGVVAEWLCACTNKNPATAFRCTACGSQHRTAVLRVETEPQWQCDACSEWVPLPLDACWQCNALAPPNRDIAGFIERTRVELPPERQRARESTSGQRLAWVLVIGILLAFLRTCLHQ